MRAPLISVIMPTYNAGKFICEAIDSVLAQTFTDYELLVVDDGSTDDTRKKIQPYGKKIRYYRQKNQGAAKARNHAAQKAKGEYLAFLDADDRWHPEKLAASYNALKGDPSAAMVCTALRLVDLQGRTVVPHIHVPVLEKYYPRILLGNLFSSQGTLIKRDIFFNYGEYCEATTLYEEWPLWNRIARNEKIIVIDTPLFDYRIKSQIPYPPSEMSLRLARQMHVLEIAFREDPLLSAWFRARCRAAVYLDFAKACLYRKQFKLVVKLTFQSIRRMPFQAAAYLYLPRAIARKVLRTLGIHYGQHSY